MSTFPACQHAKKRRTQSQHQGALAWLAAEPFRVFFFIGALWSVVGVLLWPLYYAQKLGWYPGLPHARLMIQGFGGAFVLGFLGTAGPRMATAPKLTPIELVWLLMLHTACGVAQLTLHMAWGDALFAGVLASLLASLSMRVLRWRREAPPPQMVLALAGLVCGIAGSGLLTLPQTYTNASSLRLANLLLYQGLLLPPVLGIGAFVFPRMLGRGFGEPKDATQSRAMLQRAGAAAALLVASFVLEAEGYLLMGYGMRGGVALYYLCVEVGWQRTQSGSLTTGLLWALGLGGLGLMLAPCWPAQHVAVEHLLYVGGFGLLMLVVGSRVLFGHSGDLAGFFVRSGWVRMGVFLGVLAALTRATPAWVPKTTISHHIYAALTWALLALLWLAWHRQRFLRRDPEEVAEPPRSAQPSPAAAGTQPRR